MKKTIAAALVGTLLLTSPVLAKPVRKGAARPAPAKVAWDAKVSRSADGNHLLGNPAAKVKLVEFISYTCPHCADYASESQGPLAAGPLRGGTLSVEVYPFFRNAVDISATLLAQCGPDGRFLGNHHAILASQKAWLNPPPAEAQQKWGTLAFPQQMKAIAVDLGLYKMMLARGYSEAQLDTCLANETLARRLADRTDAASTNLGVQGTPSFLVNGKLQHAHAWAELKPLIDAALR